VCRSKTSPRRWLWCQAGLFDHTKLMRTDIQCDRHLRLPNHKQIEGAEAILTRSKAWNKSYLKLGITAMFFSSNVLKWERSTKLQILGASTGSKTNGFSACKDSLHVFIVSKDLIHEYLLAMKADVFSKRPMWYLI